jgi:hypothetical protein
MCFACRFIIFFVSLKHEKEGTDCRGNGNACTLSGSFGDGIQGGNFSV